MYVSLFCLLESPRQGGNREINNDPSCKTFTIVVFLQMKRLADFKDKHDKIVGNPLPREEKKLFTENNVVNVLVDRDQKNRRVLIINMGCKYTLEMSRRVLAIVRGKIVA